MTSLFRQIKLALLLFAAVVAVGTIGYRIAGLGLLDALYQTVVTITTVGYTDLASDLDVKPFTIVMIGIGTLTAAVILSLITGAVVEARLREYVGRRKVESKVRKLNNHFILCGFGRFGRPLAAELRRRKHPFVVLETGAAKAELARELDYLVLEQDATEEESLKQAGLLRSSGVLTTLGSDADNVYVTLTVKQMKRSLRVIALAQNDRAKSKLLAAGADDVVSPYQLGGNWMAQAITSPAVADFMKIATGANPLNFFMDEQRIDEHSRLCDMELRETPIRSELGVIVVAVRKPDGAFKTNPSPTRRLAAGDILVSIGDFESLARLKRMAAGAETGPRG